MTKRRDQPFILGLTGSIAMGKSTVAEILEDLGIPVFDADAQVRRMQEPGGMLVSEIEAAFPGTTGPQGVDRQQLGAVVFGDPARLAELERIVHPAVRKAREAFMNHHADQPLVVFDIPLLFEKGGDADVDAVAVVSAPAEVQRTRALAREGMTEEKLAHILTLQMPDEEKRRRADFIIDTGTTLAQTRREVEGLVDNLRASLRG